MEIREANLNDYDAIWEIFSYVIKAGDTYSFDPDLSKEAMADYWFAPNMHTYVLESEGQIIGTYVIKPNQPRLGAHIANGSYMVHPDARGKGVGKAMGEHSIQQATKLGYRGMQFNFVVSTNTVGVTLWKKLGFAIIGTIPQGFKHSKLGYVDAYIMFREL